MIDEEQFINIMKDIKDYIQEISETLISLKQNAYPDPIDSLVSKGIVMDRTKRPLGANDVEIPDDETILPGENLDPHNILDRYRLTNDAAGEEDNE